MALDFIGVGGGRESRGQVCRWIRLGGGNPALPIDVIVRAMVAWLPVSLAGDALPLW